MLSFQSFLLFHVDSVKGKREWHSMLTQRLGESHSVLTQYTRILNIELYWDDMESWNANTFIQSQRCMKFSVCFQSCILVHFRSGAIWSQVNFKKAEQKYHACVPLKSVLFVKVNFQKERSLKSIVEIRIYKLCTVLTPHVSFNCFSGWRVRRPHEDIWFFSNNICVLYAKRVSLFLNK